MAGRTLTVAFVGDDRGFTKVAGRVSSTTRSLGAGAVASAAKFAVLGVGLVGFAAAAKKAASITVDFDKSMRNVNSIAQLNEKQYKALSKSVLALAGKTAQAPLTLSQGLYDLESSGFDARQSMTILASTAKAATAGLTDTATSTKAVAAVLNAYHQPASAAAKVSDTLFETVNRGVVSFEELASTIGDVLPFSSALHVNLQQVGAAVSTMTKEGISAPETMTRLKSVLEAFIKPSDAMAKSIKLAGADSGEALVKHKGLQGALEALLKTTDGSKESVAKLFPNIRALGGALALTGDNAKSAHGDLAAFKDVTGATDTALSQQAKSISYQWSKIKSTVSAAAINVGSVLIPAVATGLDTVGGLFKKVQDGWSTLKATFASAKGQPLDPFAKQHGDLGKQRSSLGALGKMLSDGVSAGVKAIDWGGLASSLSAGVQSAFTAVNWAAIGSTMATGLSAAFNATGTLPGAIAQGISLALSQVNTDVLAKRLADVAIRMLAVIADPGFWLSHWKQVLAIVTLVIPVGKLLKIPGAATLFKFVSKPVFDAILFLGKGALSLFTKVAGEAGLGLLEGLEKVFPRVANALLDLVTKAPGWLKGLPGRLKGVALKAGDGIAQGIAAGAGKVAAVIGGIVGKIISLFTKPVGVLFRIGADMVGRLASGIASRAGSAASAVAGIASKLTGPFRSLAGEFFNIGTNIIGSLGSGIKAAAQGAIDAAVGVAKGAVDKVAGFLKIKSPSKVFHDIGQNVVVGFVQGILSKADQVTAGLNRSLLFPVDAAISALEAKKDALQKTWDAIDARAQKSNLVADINTAGARTTSTSGTSSTSSSASSLSIAKTIVQIGQQMGAGAKAIKAAIEAGIVESGLRNLNYGDRDSVGVFQQRPSQGWTGLTNVAKAAQEFFQHAMGANSGNLSAGALAQSVQRSAYPGRYDAVGGQADAILKQIGGGGTGSSASNIKDAVKSLTQFNTEAARAKKLAKIDLQIQNLTQLNTFKAAMKDIRSNLKDLAATAAAAWRAMQEKQIDATHTAALKAIGNSADAQELARLQGQDATEADAEQTRQLNQDLADARAAGDVKAIKNAQDAITSYQRQKREAQLQASIDAATASADASADAQKDGLDQQEADYAASLNARLQVLTDNLAKGKESYAKWAKDVNKILSTYGLGVDVSADQEAAVNAGPGPLGTSTESPKKNGKYNWGDGKGYAHTVPRWDWGDGNGFIHTAPKATPAYAAGTPDAPAGMAWVGEQGPELVEFKGGERVHTNGASMAIAGGGGGVTEHHHHYHGPVMQDAKFLSYMRELERKYARRNAQPAFGG